MSRKKSCCLAMDILYLSGYCDINPGRTKKIFNDFDVFDGKLMKIQIKRYYVEEMYEDHHRSSLLYLRNSDYQYYMSHTRHDESFCVREFYSVT